MVRTLGVGKATMAVHCSLSTHRVTRRHANLAHNDAQPCLLPSLELRSIRVAEMPFLSCLCKLAHAASALASNCPANCERAARTALCGATGSNASVNERICVPCNEVIWVLKRKVVPCLTSRSGHESDGRPRHEFIYGRQVVFPCQSRAAVLLLSTKPRFPNPFILSVVAKSLRTTLTPWGTIAGESSFQGPWVQDLSIHIDRVCFCFSLCLCQGSKA